MENAIEFKFQIDKKAPLLRVYSPDQILDVVAEVQKTLEFLFGKGYVFAEATEILQEAEKDGKTGG